LPGHAAAAVPDLLSDLARAFALFGSEPEEERVDPDTLVYVACGRCGKPTSLADATQDGSVYLCPACTRDESDAVPGTDETD
jgi:DNA-directed RNA polymerase subunit RPC12/RpoP